MSRSTTCRTLAAIFSLQMLSSCDGKSTEPELGQLTDSTMSLSESSVEGTGSGVDLESISEELIITSNVSNSQTPEPGRLVDVELVVDVSELPDLEPLHSHENNENETVYSKNISVWNYVLNPDFSREALPSEEMRMRYDDWWAAYKKPRTYKSVTYTRAGNQYPDPPLIKLSLNYDGDASGQYSMGREFGLFLYSLVDFFRTTGDPAVLEEIYFWANEMMVQYADWDGRGYIYSRFMHTNNAQSKAQHYENDKVFLDAQMIFGYSSMLSWALHINRTSDSKYGELADHWFTYWDEVHIPKWLYRTTVEEEHPGPVYNPPAELSLENAVNWNGPGTADDKQGHWSPFRPPASPPDRLGWHTDEHPLMYPTRDYGHPLALSIVGHYNLGRYFLDINKQPRGTWGALHGNASGQEHLDEAHRRLVFWNKGTGDGTGAPQADGSRTYWMQTSNSNERMRMDSYATHVNNAMNYMYWEKHPLVTDEDMQGYAKQWYDEAADIENDVVYFNMEKNLAQSGTQNLCMARFSDGRRINSDVTGVQVRTTGYLAYWDSSGKIEQLLDLMVGDDPTRHIVGNGRPWGTPSACTTNTVRTEQNHLSARMSLAACRAGLCSR